MSSKSVRKKLSFPLKIFSKQQETADLVRFTEEILNGKLYFLCSELYLRGWFILTDFMRIYFRD